MVLYENEIIPEIDKHSLKEYIFIRLCRLFVICMDYVFQRCQFVSLWTFLKVDFFTPAISLKITYRTRAIITRGLYTFYPLFGVQKRFFKGLFS